MRTNNPDADHCQGEPRLARETQRRDRNYANVFRCWRRRSPATGGRQTEEPRAGQQARGRFVETP